MLETIIGEYSLLLLIRRLSYMKKAFVVLGGLVLVYVVFYIAKAKQFRRYHFPGAYGCISIIKKNQRYLKTER